MEYDLEQYMYLKGVYNNRIGVIAIGVTLLDAGDWDITFAGSVVSGLDNFNAKAGRNIALQRLRSNNIRTRRFTTSGRYDIDKVGLWDILIALRLDNACREKNLNSLVDNGRLCKVFEFTKNKVKSIQEAKV